MKTKYGEINEAAVKEYVDRLVGKIFKLLPLKEEKNPTLKKYIDSLLTELIGGKNLIYSFNMNSDYISLINSIEGIKQIDDMDLYRRKVFECITICRKIM